MRKTHVTSLILSFCFLLSLFTSTVEAKSATTIQSSQNSTSVQLNNNTPAVRLNKNSSAVQLNKTTATIYTTGSVTLKVTTSTTSPRITWSSSDSKIAKVSSNGKVTGVKPGTCTITASVNGKKVKCKITVKKVTASYLKKKLGKSVDTNMIADFCAADYDGDGVLEAFAFVGTDSEDGAYGSVYFVSASTTKTMLKNEGFWVYHDNHLLDFKKKKYYTIGKYYATSSPTYIFGVKNGTPFEDPYSLYSSSLRQIGTTNQLKAVQSTLDGMYDATMGFCMGRTFKTYDLYWDNGFHEYGGIAITSKQLLKCTGAKKILNEIKAASSGISDIIYRGNNTININYYDKYADGSYTYKNATLKLTGKKVSYVEADYPYGNTKLERSNQDGIYLTALHPEFAVYPSRFPVK